ncbi:winged helix-turn-helix transcriptional regulator [Pseudodesulfovibrio sp.]|uniref:winged helix-turn-helix transcriptional regulator n=1 Tax=unclassified Pseudodesulfovibrio TaxID=2661612 RepID=UPI003AFFD42E
MYTQATPCTPKQAGEKKFSCFFELSQMVIGGKWKPMILFRLGQQPAVRFGRLRNSISGISEKMLIQQLKELIDDGMVHREVYKEVPPKVEYSLTPMGRTLIPVLDNLFAWGRQYASYLVAQSAGEEMVPGEVLADIDDIVAI